MKWTTTRIEHHHYPNAIDCHQCKFVEVGKERLRTLRHEQLAFIHLDFCPSCTNLLEALSHMGREKTNG